MDSLNSGDPVQAETRRGVLCAPFHDGSREADAEWQRHKHTLWVIQAAEEAGIVLSTVSGSFDSYQQVLDRIREAIREADLVVVMIRDANPNVFFEAGYAMGLAKPLLFIAHRDEQIPFDVTGIERFHFNEIDPESGAELTQVMSSCLEAPQLRGAVGRGLGSVRDSLLALSPRTPLFGKCLEHALAELSDWIASWSDAAFDVYGAERVFDMGVFIMGALSHSGFATAYYTGHSSWRFAESGTLEPDYFEATRQAVNRGRSVSRIYVIETAKQLDEQTFRDRAWADASAGLDICYILERKLPHPRARDFGLWDDALLGEIEYRPDPDGRPRLHRCSYSSDEFHLHEARQWQRAIEVEAKPCPDLPSEPRLLVESATKILSHYCHDGRFGKPDCSAYHGGWQRLRLCNVVSTPRWHADFYSDALWRWSGFVKRQESDRQLDVLITGLADYGMLYWIAQCIPHRIRRRCTFHVLDICRTPLESCRWLQQRLARCDPPMEIDVQLHHCDVFDNALEDDSMDLVVSDAFLTRFAAVEEKQNVLKEWLRVLRSDGRVITTARLRERDTDIQDADRQLFVERALRAASESSMSTPEIEAVASDYARYITSHPFLSDDELKHFLETNLPDTFQQRVTCESLPHMEMVSGTYAHIEVGKWQ